MDNGYSGLNFDRPGFSRMMADVERGKIEQIVVQSASCISRDSVEFYTWLEEMKRQNVRVVSIQDVGELNGRLD